MPAPPFNIVAIGQSGRLSYEAVLLAASLRLTNPDFLGRLLIAVPQKGPLWAGENPSITDPTILDLLAGYGAEIIPFPSRHFGANYPYGNKIEALSHLPDEPFLFLDTDTLVTGDLKSVKFDFKRPSASMKRENTWPQEELYGPSPSSVWKSLYDRFGLDFETSQDTAFPVDYWQRYLYFNAGWFFYQSPKTFGDAFLKAAVEISTNPPPELSCQPMNPWLDQVALPLVIHALKGGRPGPGLAGLDGDVTCHWRLLPLLYARESDRVVEVLETICAPAEVKKVLKDYGPIKKMVYQGQGQQVRALFDRANLPRKEQAIRNTIKREGFWVR